jgi:hypothetical protein
MLTKEDLEVLKAAFAPHELRAVIVAESQDQNGNWWVTLQAYVPSGVIEERLDRVDPAWSLEIETVEPSSARLRARSKKEDGETKGFFVLARLTVKGTTRVGIGFDPDPRTAATMAFKNAAGRFGIGRYLEGPEWKKRKKVPDERTYRRISYSRELTWDEALSLLDGQSPPPKKPEPRPVHPEDEEPIPF